MISLIGQDRTRETVYLYLRVKKKTKKRKQKTKYPYKIHTKIKQFI